MMWVIIGAVLALLVFVIYSFLTGGVVRKVSETLFRVEDRSGDQLDCAVVPWTHGDRDGDGIRDDLAKCEQFKEQREDASS